MGGAADPEPFGLEILTQYLALGGLILDDQDMGLIRCHLTVPCCPAR